ncbi:hypothetical protein ABIB00_005040 [Bradyrhizobium sp. LB14.3]|uniref:hypothetical protein n=1 Tax=Bradyrhizobium sp. LB14.3 TaxID=3156328 RepID=UPI003397582C
MSKLDNLKARIAAIEEKLNMRPGANGKFYILLIEGGCGEIRWSYAGVHRWQREIDEGLQSFIERSANAAKAAGELALNIGGLPRSDEMAGFADFESWFAYVQPNYSDVPPEEKAGYARRS